MLEKITVDVLRKDVKNITLRVHRDGTLSMTVPFGMKEEAWHAFLNGKQEWIEKALAKLPVLPQYDYHYDEEHWLLGEQVKLRLLPSLVDSCKRRKDVVSIHYKRWNAKPGTIMGKYWAESLELVLEKMVRKWAKRMRVTPGGVMIKPTKSRWGSCNVKTGELQFSLELSAKPAECVEFVVVHELCHLLEPSHSPRFHMLLTGFLPDWKERERKLRAFPREFY